MPLVLDENLNPALYPLAWLIGDWFGSGALQEHPEEAEAKPKQVSKNGLKVEQELHISVSDASLAWKMRTYVLDAPAPAPPTSAFYEQPVVAENLNRQLLLKENGVLKVDQLLPGQNEAKAKAAKPGSLESYLSYAVSFKVKSQTLAGESFESNFAGEVRGPRLQLACLDYPNPYLKGQKTKALRMFGMVNGSIMWLQEIGADFNQLTPHLSFELKRK